LLNATAMMWMLVALVLAGRVEPPVRPARPTAARITGALEGRHAWSPTPTMR
jgi:hypothetical protein